MYLPASEEQKEQIMVWSVVEIIYFPCYYSLKKKTKPKIRLNF